MEAYRRVGGSIKYNGGRVDPDVDLRQQTVGALLPCNPPRSKLSSAKLCVPWQH